MIITFDKFKTKEPGEFYYIKAHKYNYILMREYISKKSGKAVHDEIGYYNDLIGAIKGAIKYIDFGSKEKLTLTNYIGILDSIYENIKEEVKDLQQQINKS